MTRLIDQALSRHTAFLLFAVVVVAWGINWTVTKIVVQSAPPFWATAIRCAIAASTLFAISLARRQLVIPKRGDIPVILAIALLHLVGFSTLVAYGLQLAPVGRSIVLGYTTPLWVAPGAWLLLNETTTKAQLIGIGVGLSGLAVMFNPLAFDWSDTNGLIGSALILLAALCWAANIIYVRAHKWISTPFQLVFWQVLLAALVLSIIALLVHGAPHIEWSASLAIEFLYGGMIGTALAYWAMAMINKSVPAVTTSLGVLATPVVGIMSSAICFGESIDASLVVAMVLILIGSTIETTSRS